MMQSAARFNWISLSSCRSQFLVRRSALTTSRGRTADPSVHSVEPEEVYATEAIRDAKRRQDYPAQDATCKDAESYIRPKSTSKSGPKLESAGVAPRIDPMAQRKRRYSKASSAMSKSIIKASDEGAGNIIVLPYDGSKVQMWRPAQMDTAEQSLRRAIEIYRRSAERGDPDSPHGRILRDLRGEDW